MVLDTIVESAARLCGARAAQLFVVDGDVFRLSRISGETPEEYRRYLQENPITRDRSSTVGRAAEDRRTHQIADVLKDADYGRPDLQRLAGFRTLLSTPMLLQDEVVGVLSMWRTDVAPFDDRERELLEEFAVQGAIVLRQVDLMRALEARGSELENKVAQLEALREVEEAVGSSLDLDEVLERIVRNAVRLTNLGFGDITLSTDGGTILEYDESDDSFHVRGTFGSSLRCSSSCGRSPSTGNRRRWADPHCRDGRWTFPTWRRATSTPSWTSCSATAGARCWPFRC